ncbi:hypothetical protein HYT17_02900 [Candidatus Microgenomates bacterium]|nr:hypothetical protein [Candidatus Microgenomates bacterium]
MQRILKVALIIIILLIFFYPKNAQAKLLPQAKGKTVGTSVKSSSLSFSTSPRLRADRKALIVYFSNLQNTTSVSYTLTYQTNGQQEGAGGTISSSGSSASRELLFGTCSKNVCRYHTNITNAKLEVRYSSTNGKTYLRRYRIKI